MVTAYHGSNVKFTQFKSDYSNTIHGNSNGFGLYFATEIETAKLYGRYIYKCKLNIRNLISQHRRRLTQQFIESLLNKLAQVDEELDYYWNFESKEKAIDSFKWCKSDIQIITLIIQTIGNADVVLSELSKLGYSHTLQSANFSKGDVHYIMFDPKDVKIVSVEDNK